MGQRRKLGVGARSCKRYKGKLYRVEVKSKWLLNEGRNWAVAYRKKNERGHFNEEVKLVHDDFVIYLGKVNRGFIKVLHERGVLHIHSDWVTFKPEKSTNDNPS